MSPEQVKKWQDEHGGPGGPSEGPDANGITVHRAADGSFINVRRDGSLAMQGQGAPTNEPQPATPEQTTAAPGAAPPPPGSGSMTQSQLEALLKQVAPNGDPRRLEFNQGTKEKQIRVPGTLGGPDTTRTIQVPYVQWIDRASGQTLEADVSSGGGYTVTFNGVKKENQGTQATAPGSTETKPRQSRVNPADTTKVQEFDPDTGQWVDAGPNDAEVQRRDKESKAEAERKAQEAKTEAEKNKPKPIEAAPGKWGYFDTSTGSPHWVPIEGTPAETQKPVQVDGQWGVWKPGKDGTPEWSTVAGPKTPTVDLPAMRLEAGKISEELKQLWEDLNARVRRGEITREQAKSEFEGRYATAQARMAEIDSTVKTQQSLYQNQLTQRGQDLGETQSRRSAATSAANEAASYVSAHSGKAGPHGPSLSAAADEMIDRAYRTQERFGANRESAPIQMGPAAQAANSLTLPGLPSPTTPMAAPGAARSELGQPGDPTLAGNAAAAAQARANPVFRPQSPVNMGAGSAPPAIQGTPSSIGDTGAPPVGSEGDSLGAAQKILTPMPGSSSASGSTSTDDGTLPALASLLEFDLPGGMKMRINNPQGQQATAMASGQGRQGGGGDDESDRIKRMRDLAPDDPNWQRSLDEQERRYGRPTPQSMFAA